MATTVTILVGLSCLVFCSERIAHDAGIPGSNPVYGVLALVIIVKVL